MYRKTYKNTTRSRRRAYRNRNRLIIGGVTIAVVLVCICIIVLFSRKQEDRQIESPIVPEETVMADTTQDGVVPEQTPEDVEPTQEPDAVEAMANGEIFAVNSMPIPSAKDGWLPIFCNQQTEEKIIAITVDDCFQADSLQQIVDKAIECGAKLTIFPIGQVALRDEQSRILKYAWENGFELENHTFTHNGLYKCSDEVLAREIYWQNLALNKILGVNYQAHFLRPMGGDARADQRIHAYIKQLNYKGVAHWNVSGSGSSPNDLMKGLKPGNIYLFHTTKNKDLDKLLNFIPYAINQGYKLVTLNEMFGYPENETTPLEGPIDVNTIPPLEPYETVLVKFKKGSYAYGVKVMQQRLLELGYLSDDPDGIFGDHTYEAVKAFQAKCGIEVTGEADVETQTRLLREDAPKKT